MAVIPYLVISPNAVLSILGLIHGPDKTEPTPAEDWRDAVFSQIADMQMIRTERWKLNVYGGEPLELYDLTGDPHELNNLFGDPAHAETLRTMLSRLEEWQNGPA